MTPPMTLQEQLASVGLRLVETLDLPAVVALAGALQAQRGQDLQVDASDVRRIGALCLQVLLSARATWAADGQVLTISNPSSDFIEAMALLGAPSLSAGQAA